MLPTPSQPYIFPYIITALHFPKSPTSPEEPYISPTSSQPYMFPYIIFPYIFTYIIAFPYIFAYMIYSCRYALHLPKSPATVAVCCSVLQCVAVSSHT